jgi:hypothetical protein
MPISDVHTAVLLAGAGGIRLARSPAEAERELASGFRPSVVLLDTAAGRGTAYAEKVASYPACAAVPILGISGNHERLRLTLLNDVGALSDPGHLGELLRILEELCLDLPGGGFPCARAVAEGAAAAHVALCAEAPETTETTA